MENQPILKFGKRVKNMIYAKKKALKTNFRFCIFAFFARSEPKCYL